MSQLKNAANSLKYGVFQAKYPFYLAGEPVLANQDIQVFNKYKTDEVLATCARANAEQVKQAIEAAEKTRTQFKNMPAFEKKQILKYVANQVKERFDEFTTVLALEGGKPLKDAKSEVNRVIDTFEEACEECTRLPAEYGRLDISERGKNCSYLMKGIPIGVCALISPFNFPLNLSAHKVAPAIAAGCPFILKPATKTPISALLLGEILAKTNIPKGAFSVLPASRDASELFQTDERVKLLSFTGSAKAGWEMKRNANKKKVVLELGGNAGCIVDDVKKDQLPHIVDRIIFGSFYQSGQSCISLQRLYVHKSVYDELKEMLVKKTKELKLGDPLDKDTFIGPMISIDDAERIEKSVNEAIEKGATALTGAKKREGALYEPTVLEGVDKSLDIYKEEAFGPVVLLEKIDTFEEGVEKVNDSKYGLQAGVFTNDLKRGFYAFNTIEAGGVVLNDIPSVRVDSMCYGGVKDSGEDREGVRYAIKHYLENRILVLKDVDLI